MKGNSRTILVVGATGRQGGAAVRHLLSDGWYVNAISRRPYSEPALALRDMGVDVLEGDLEDSASIDRALAGAQGVFSVQDFWEHGYDGEIRQGEKLVDAAVSANIRYFVQSSMYGSDRDNHLTYSRSKYKVEQYLLESGLPFTILRPAFFMENLETAPWRDAVLGGSLELAYPANRPLYMVAADDIGGVVAQVFDDPSRYAGHRIDLVSDAITPLEMASALTNAIGREVSFRNVPAVEYRETSPAWAALFQWLACDTVHVDLRELRRIYPGLTRFSRWASHSIFANETSLAAAS